MIIRKAFKFQLKTNLVQENQLRRFSGCCRLVWNKALALQKSLLDEKKGCLNYNKMAGELVSWKNSPELEFLKEVHSQPLQQTLKNLDKALKEAFNKKNPKRFPRFKKKGHGGSFRYPQGFKIDEINSRVYLPKISWVSYRHSRKMEGTAKNITVTESGGKWFVSIQTEQETEINQHLSSSIIGLDVGIAKFATLSNGDEFPPVNSFKTLQKKLAKEQHKLAKKVKFSSNWKKQKARINKLHIKIANIRKDYLHKTSTTISKNHAMIIIEDLKISNMSKSAKGDKQNHGKNVKAKSGLNKSILDQGWFEFRRQLEYKQFWNGGNIIAINPKNTSRKCAACGHIAAQNRTTQSKFECVACGHAENADINAAQNILAAGHAVLACGETIRPKNNLAVSVKQEPTERAAKAA